MRGLMAAVSFLTVAPVPAGFALGRDDLARAAAWFPVAGLLIGAALAALDMLAMTVVPLAPSAVATVIAMSLVSGGLHLDGLADTADGMLSRAPREKVIGIMKDSRSGPMGVFAVAGVLMLKAAALFSLPPGGRMAAVFLAAVAGRCAMAAALNVGRDARGPDGLGAALRLRTSAGIVTWAFGFLAAAGWLAAGMAGGAVAVSAAVVVAVMAYLAHRIIGGWTGDVYGAVCELTEAITLLTLAALMTGGMR